jgi:hypothetical protein
VGRGAARAERGGGGRDHDLGHRHGRHELNNTP